MPFRDEILRGIRLAAILFALVLLAVVIHRMVRVDVSTTGAQPEASQKPAPLVIGGSSPGSIPPPPPTRGNPVTLVRQGNAGK
jgi:hypothetical protein